MPGSVKSSVKGSVKSSVKILEAIRANKNVSAKEISQTLGISLRAVEKQLSKLKESGRLRRIGPAKGGYWEIVE
jgi:ATP-dependent DNA helicase RecG